jgi:hypothetical protein
MTFILNGGQKQAQIKVLLDGSGLATALEMESKAGRRPTRSRDGRRRA